MLKNISAFALVAVTVIATTSGAYAGSTAAETSQAAVEASWDELHRVEDTGRASFVTPANWTTESAIAISSNVLGVAVPSEIQEPADQTAQPAYKSLPTASTSVSIF